MVNFEAHFSGTYFLLVSVGRSVASVGAVVGVVGPCVPCGCPEVLTLYYIVNI